MREIIFKAKKMDGGEWIEGNLITGIEDNPEIQPITDNI